MNGIERIAAERTRHVRGEGFTIERDMGYTKGELVDAARCYIAAARYAEALASPMPTWARDGAAPWPWDESWWKPSDDPIRNLEKAGALLAADIDRMQALIDLGDKVSLPREG